MAAVEIAGFEGMVSSVPSPFDVTTDRYKPAIYSLLPRGPMWPRDDATNVGKYVAALSAEPSRVQRRGEDLLRQLDPREAFELLEDWERVLGLPDCDPAPVTIAERQATAHAKLTATGLSSFADFIEAAANLGYTVTIVNANEGTFTIAESEIGDEGDEIGDPWEEWIVTTPSGSSDAQLLCLFQQHAPLHTVVVINFT